MNGLFIKLDGVRPRYLLRPRGGAFLVLERADDVPPRPALPGKTPYRLLPPACATYDEALRRLRLLNGGDGGAPPAGKSR